MRPTGLGYRSPREKTPAFYTAFVSQKFFHTPFLIFINGKFRPIKSSKHSLVPSLNQRKSRSRSSRSENGASALWTASCMSRWRSDWRRASRTWAPPSTTTAINSRNSTHCHVTLLSKLWAVSRKKSYTTTSTSVSHWCMTLLSPWITASSRPSSPCQATVESSPILLWGSPLI